MTLADSYGAFLLDLDGVLYRGDQAVPGAASTVAELRRRGPVLMVTNNSAPTPSRVAEKLQGMGFDASPEDVVTSAQALVPLVLDRAGEGARVFVVGEEGLRAALEEAGMELLDGQAEQADVVAVGWDRSVDYEKLRRASILVARGARLLATNIDASYPAPGGELWPGTGAILQAIQVTTGARAEFAGKPRAALFEAALERAGTRRALVVGDRLETDVAGAHAAGLDAALVLSGAATYADLLDHDQLPVSVMSTLSGLLEDRAPVRVRPADGSEELVASELVAEAGLQELPGPSERLIAEGLQGSVAVRVEEKGAYLHSLVVVEGSRGSGTGSLLVAAAARRAAALGAGACFLVSEDAEAFFSRLGFHAIDRSDLPRWVGPLITSCSESATAMRREIAQTSQGGTAWAWSRER